MLSLRRQAALVGSSVALSMTMVWPVAAGQPGLFTLTGPDGDFRCNTLAIDPHEGESIGTVRYIVTNGSVTAQIRLRNAMPNTDYAVRLVQGDPSVDYEDEVNPDLGCHVLDSVLRTNAAGIGTLRITEPILAPAVQVTVDTGQMYSQPTYVASGVYHVR